MQEHGRRRGGKPGTALSPRSVRLTYGRLSAAFELACRDRKLAANPCRYAEQPDQAMRDGTTWSEAELRRFLAAAGEDRLAACWLLSALGLKWSDISNTDGTLTIARTRVLVDGTIIEKSPKSKRSWRVLPLFEPVTGALEALQARQHEEMDAAGAAYANSGYVVADEKAQLGNGLQRRRCSGVDLWMQIIGKPQIAVEGRSQVRMWTSVHGSRSVHRLLYFTAVQRRKCTSSVWLTTGRECWGHGTGRRQEQQRLLRATPET